MCFCSDLEVLDKASAGDFAAVDLFDVDVTGTEQPRHQHLQVVYELPVDFWRSTRQNHFNVFPVAWDESGQIKAFLHCINSSIYFATIPTPTGPERH